MSTDARDACAIIVATESDGDLPWREVAGRPLLAWSVTAFMSSPSIACILLVVPDAQVGRAMKIYRQASQEKVIAVPLHGARRRDGVELALRTLPADCRLVTIHDARRPLVTPMLIDAGVALARATGAAVPVEPVTETIKRVRDGVIVGAVPRKRLSRVQSPQIFARTLVQEAYHHAAPELDPPDEAALLLTVGLPVSCFEGSAENLYVASVDELPVVEELLWRRLD
jgi:2-C-methyl-D-erythritol 4-phosphate cytidylyltransferase